MGRIHQRLEIPVNLYFKGMKYFIDNVQSNSLQGENCSFQNNVL